MTEIITTEIIIAPTFSTEDIIIPRSTLTRKTKTDTAITVSDIMTVL